MAVKQFYLVGLGSPDAPREIEISAAQDWASLQKLLGLEYNIVEPKGTLFQTPPV